MSLLACRLIFLYSVFLLLACDRAAATDYYVDPAGSDSKSGTRETAPWQSVANVNATTFQPGDSIRFKRGGAWTGPLHPLGSGSSASQITLGAYGTGAKPLINGAGNWAVIFLSSQEYWTIDGFEVINPAAGDGNRSGIRVDASGSGTVHGIRILNNDVHDVRGIRNVNDGARNCGGIFFWINEPGKADCVLIQGNTVRDIYGQGIAFNGEAEYAGGGMNYANCSPNVTVRGNAVLSTSGDGILMLGTDNEQVEYNEVGYAGQLSDLYNNIAAAWPTRHINGVWQYNEVHHTAALAFNDSTAFDNDGFVQGTTLFQYNYSHDNAGGFIMEYKWDWSAADTGNTTVRYNISVNDTRVVASNRGGMDFYNNVVYAPGATLDVQWSSAGRRVLFRNNVFVAAGSTAEFNSQSFANNTFNGGIVRPLTTGENRTRNPLFVNPNASGDLAGFIPQSGSPEIGSGTALAGNGGKDFWGSSVPASPTAPNRGASQIASIAAYTATPAFLGLSGPDAAGIPITGTTAIVFAATVRDQNFRRIANPAVTWSLRPSVSGCWIDADGTLTITAAAAPQRLAVQAACGSVTNTGSFKLSSNYLLSDSFNSASYGAATFNSTLTADQEGTLAPVTYTLAGNSQDWQIQHGNGSQMLLAAWHTALNGDLYVSPNHNFADDANAVNKPLRVQVDLKITDSADVSNWATIAIGNSQNAFVDAAANKFSSLFRHSGGTQQFASGTDVTVGGLSWAPSGSTIAVILSDTAGTGSPFKGNGSVARIMVNGALAGTCTLAQMGGADGYISFEGRGVYACYDNLSIAVAQWSPGSDWVWDNGSSSGLWNTSDANWRGDVWVNAVSNNAHFTGVGGMVRLAEAITAGGVSVGTSSFNVPDTAFTNGSLTAASLTVQGKGDNGGMYANNPTLTLAVPTVSVTGDVAVGRANLAVAGGTVTASRLISSADWGRVAIQGGTVLLSNGVDGSANTAATFQLDLNGGALCTPFIKVADRELGANNNAWLTFNGTVLHPTVSTNNFITLYGGNQNAYVGNGGAVFSTDGRDIGLGVNLVAYGNGGLTKSGLGTLTLSGQNSYLGSTRIQGGVLSFASASAVPVSSQIDIANGAIMNLNFTGDAAVGGLRLNGVAQQAGVYGADTQPAYFTGAGHVVVPPPFTNALAGAANDGISNFRRMKYGFFVHYVLGGVRNSDGSWPSDANDMADRFDAAGFAEDLQSMGVEYVIFTAWHYNVVCLWPSAAMEQWMPGHTVRRDLLGDMIDAVRAKGIRVLFYTHPRDGHDMNTADQITTGWGPGSGGYDPDWNQFNRQKWNDFINDIYADLIERYGSRIDGMFIDEGSPLGDSYRVVDYPRLRQTVKSRQPDLLMMQNYYGNNYSCDIGATEVSYWQSWVPGTDPNNWPATGRPMSMVMGSSWSATQPPGIYTPRYNATEMFRMTVLRAGVNSTDGGGVNWASGPYAGGGWETGVLEQMRQIGSWIAPIRRSICNTLPSQSWITPANATINSLANGIVATRSFDDGTEFVHVLTPPATQAITLPAPADGRGYSSASLLASGHAVTLVRNADASLTLTLQAGDAWDSRDTVIALEPVTVTWTGASNDAGPGTAAWADWMDNFSNGVPVSTRFRSGDSVIFSGLGASSAVPWANSFSVGGLRFSGKDYRVRPAGAPTLTLDSGRIDVAEGITASFEETGFGGPLRLAGDAGLIKTGGGTLVLDLPSDVRGNTLLSDGVVAVRSGALGVQGNIVFDGGTLRLLPGNGQDLSSRIRHGGGAVRIDTGDNDVVWATPLHDSNTGGLFKLGAGTLALAGGAAAEGPVTVEAGALELEPATTGSVLVPNAGFEDPAYAPQGWAYNPTGTGWSFSSSSGTAANGSPWVAAAPEGVQVAFLQNNGTMSAEVSAGADGLYRLSFLAANRPGYPAGGLVVALDGVQLAVYQPGQLGGAGDFNRFELPAVRLAAGSHTLSFQGQQNGADSDTLIDDIRFSAAEAGALRAGTALALTGPGASFVPAPGTVSLDSLAGVAGSSVVLADTALVITGNGGAATFAGRLSGVGSLTITGTLRLVGDAALDFSGALTNHGILDIMTWNGTLPAGFVNTGTVLDRRAVRIDAFERSGQAFSVTLTAYAGHVYQLRRADDLSGPWENIGPALTGDNAPITLSDPAGAAGNRRFYRVMVQP